MRLARRASVRVELIVADALQHETEIRGLGAADLVAGEQVALGALEAEPRDPHPRRFGNPPHAHRRIAEPGRLTAHDEIRVEHHVRAARDAPPCTAAIVGFEIVCNFAHVDAYWPIPCRSATESQTRPPDDSASAWPLVAQSSW